MLCSHIVINPENLWFKMHVKYSKYRNSQRSHLWAHFLEPLPIVQFLTCT